MGRTGGDESHGTLFTGTGYRQPRDVRQKVLVYESVAQIAETFGMKENSVSVKLMRLRKKLRKKLEKEGVVL